MAKIEKLFPIIAARITNIQIKKQAKPKDKILESIENKIPDTIIESQEWITRNAYLDETQRRTVIETKGSWLLVGASIAISLISIMINSLLDPKILWVNIVFLYSIVHFAATGLGVYLATQISSINIPNTNTLFSAEKSTQKIRLEIAKELLLTTTLNRSMTDQKANFVDAAQNHFLHGLLSMSVGFFIIFICQLIIFEYPQ